MLTPHEREKILKLFRERRRELRRGRLDIPRRVPPFSAHDLWDSNMAGSTLFMPVSDAQALAFRGLPLAMTVVTKGVPAAVPASLQAMTPAQVRTDLGRPSKNGKSTIQFLNTLLWLVAAGIIASIVYMSVLERLRDFAVFKATGASSRSLYGGLALQAVLLSVTAALVATVIAHLLTPGFPFAVELQASAVARLLVVALVVGLVASLVGLRRAVAVDPALAFGGG